MSIIIKDFKEKSQKINKVLNENLSTKFNRSLSARFAARNDINGNTKLYVVVTDHNYDAKVNNSDVKEYVRSEVRKILPKTELTVDVAPLARTCR